MTPLASPARAPRGAVTLLTALCLAACGGGEGPSARTAQAAETQDTAPHITSPLLHDDGSVMPSDPAAAPSDSAARTRAGRYATPAQAEQLERTLGERAISIRVDGGADAAAAVAQAVLLAHAQRAALALDSDAPVLVRGDDPRLAASAADGLQAATFTRVFVVTP